MALIIDLPDEEVRALEAKARACGVSAEDYTRQLLERDLNEERRAPEPFWKPFTRRMHALPSEEFDLLPADGAHRDVMEFTSRLGPRTVITTDDVLAEFLGYCASYPNLAGSRIGRASPPERSRYPHRSAESGFVLDGLTLYNARPDKGYSLTDCISMQTMRRERLTHALTNDRHFEQEGFHAQFRLS